MGQRKIDGLTQILVALPWWMGPFLEFVALLHYAGFSQHCWQEPSRYRSSEIINHFNRRISYPGPMNSIDALNDFITVKTKDYQDCIDVLEHDFLLEGVLGNIRFHHLKFDGNGLPMVKALAELLYQYIIDYCIASRNRTEPLTAQQATQLTKEARRLFRHPPITSDDPDKTGEAGEALLFLLSEAVLKAPQIVAKMELKTNHADEVKGSDGIHVKWNPTDKIIEFYFGESKLYTDVGAAMTAALKSINDFHDNKMYKHEFSMITKHFKYADDKIKNEIFELIKLGEPSSGVRINHACLIGYDWKKYGTLPPTGLNDKFRELLRTDGKQIIKALNKKFSSFPKKHLRFEIFFIPFPSVAEFRDCFNSALD